MSDEAFAAKMATKLSADQELMVGIVFAESSNNASATGDAENRAVAASFANIAYYAKWKEHNKKKCYNDSFGTGTVSSAVKATSLAHGAAQYKKVMTGDKLKPVVDLEMALNPDERKKLMACVDAVTATALSATALVTVGQLGGSKTPVQFNRATDSPPSARQEKLGTLSGTTFYGFVAGRECQ